MKKYLQALFIFSTFSSFGQSITLTPYELNQFLPNGGNKPIMLTRYGLPPTIFGTVASGTPNAPFPVNLNYPLFRIEAGGFNGNDFTGTRAYIHLAPSENWSPGSNGTKINFGTSTNGFSIAYTKMTISHDGKVGIGIEEPNSRLHIFNGSSGVTPNSAPAVFIEDNRNTYLNLAAPNANETGVLFGRPDDTGTSGGIIYRSNKDMHLRTNGNVTRMTISSTGNVGIGTTTPSHKLDVIGNVNSSTGYTVNGSPIAGYYFNTNWATIAGSTVDSTFDNTCMKVRRIMIPELTANAIADADISIYMRTSSGDTKAIKLPYISEAGGATSQISAFAKKPGEIIVYRHTFKSCRFNAGVPESYTGEPVMVNINSLIEYRVVIVKK